MTDEKLEEVRRLAQASKDEAREARHVADTAARDGANHERTCAERYGRINEQLSEIKVAASKANDAQKESNGKIYDMLHRLEVAIATQSTGTATKATTTDLLIRWGCGLGGLGTGFIGLLYAIMH